MVGVPAERIVRIGDNKGPLHVRQLLDDGDTGPCGPCTEIFYDHGPEIAGGLPAALTKTATATSRSGTTSSCSSTEPKTVMHPLPKPSVDTGMGLERIATVLQGKHSNYEIDTFVALIDSAKKEVDAAGAGACDRSSPSLKVIADHIRACSFTVADGVIPSNEGRGYVLRRITRRAIRHGYKLGARTLFFHKLVATLAAEMGEAYPELRQNEKRITDVLKTEEERFFQTIANGMEILEGALANLGTTGAKQVDGETAFKLHDTYWLPRRPDCRRAASAM